MKKNTESNSWLPNFITLPSTCVPQNLPRCAGMMVPCGGFRWYASGSHRGESSVKTLQVAMWVKLVSGWSEVWGGDVLFFLMGGERMCVFKWPFDFVNFVLGAKMFEVGILEEEEVSQNRGSFTGGCRNYPLKGEAMNGVSQSNSLKIVG